MRFFSSKFLLDFSLHNICCKKGVFLLQVSVGCFKFRSFKKVGRIIPTKIRPPFCWFFLCNLHRGPELRPIIRTPRAQLQSNNWCVLWCKTEVFEQISQDLFLPAHEPRNKGCRSTKHGFSCLRNEYPPTKIRFFFYIGRWQTVTMDKNVFITDELPPEFAAWCCWA